MKLLTVQQLAEILQTPASWIHERTRNRTPSDQQIPHIRLGRYVRFNEDEVLQWMANGCKPLPANSGKVKAITAAKENNAQPLRST